MTTMNDVWTAYDRAAGRWTGCNWPTCYGSLGLDLDRVSPSQAHRRAARWRALAAGEVAGEVFTAGEEAFLADAALHLRLRVALTYPVEHEGCRLEVCGDPARRFCAEVLAREWEFASGWLEEVESDIHWADREAQEAVEAAEGGDWRQAIAHASQACAIESGYDTPRRWRRLKRAIEQVAAVTPCRPGPELRRRPLRVSGETLV
jgi:hypothetical protein